MTGHLPSLCVNNLVSGIYTFGEQEQMEGCKRFFHPAMSINHIAKINSKVKGFGLHYFGQLLLSYCHLLEIQNFCNGLFQNQESKFKIKHMIYLHVIIFYI